MLLEEVDDGFGFGARDQDVFVDDEASAIKLLTLGQVGDRDACEATSKQFVGATEGMSIIDGVKTMRDHP